MGGILLAIKLSPFLSHLRRITFIPFVLSWFIKLPAFLVAAYPIVMVFSFIYYHLKGKTLTEVILGTDIGWFFEDSPQFSFQRRLWNIWHFRNYKEEKSAKEKRNIFLLRILVIIFYAFFFITTIRIIRIYFPNWMELLIQTKEFLFKTLNRLLPNNGK